MTNPFFICIIAALLLIPFSSISLAADKPTLNVYTYSSFTSDWGPGPKVKKGFETLFNEVINPIVEEMNRQHRLSGQQKKQTIHPNALPRLKRGRRL